MWLTNPLQKGVGWYILAYLAAHTATERRRPALAARGRVDARLLTVVALFLFDTDCSVGDESTSLPASPSSLFVIESTGSVRMAALLPSVDDDADVFKGGVAVTD